MSTNIITHDRVIWTDISCPTPDDMAQLQDQYPQFHRLNLHDCQTDLEFPKLEPHQDYLFLVVQVPLWDEEKEVYRPSEIDIFLTRGTLVTSHAGNLRPLNDLFQQAQTDEQWCEKLMGQGASPLLYAVLQVLADSCFPYMDRINQTIRHIEDHLFNEDTEHLIKDIAFVRRDVIALRHILRPQLDVIQRLEKGKWPFIQEGLHLYWSDINTSLLKLHALLDEQRDVINGLSDTVDTLASHRIDGVVRVLTLITILTAPLTLLATVFGINIEFTSPKFHSLLFITINVAGITLTALLVWYLHRKRWL
ncbi:MAG: magnesium transporter CorA family protein [Chloroflexi bacterium]|nr:magnesium transporter CorA family protein [Chloroflexota bacterium]